MQQRSYIKLRWFVKYKYIQIVAMFKIIDIKKKLCK